MADPPLPSLNPQDVARRSFEVARRGYEQQQVRAFLHELSVAIERLQRSETDLRERFESTERRLAAATGEKDEASLLAMLGEETARVLTSAHEAAAEIRAKAEGSVERIIDEATAQAGQTRAGAAAEADRRLQEAKAEAEALLTAARNELAERSQEAESVAAGIRAEGASQAKAIREDAEAQLLAARAEADEIVAEARLQGKDMVAEAQTVRERVLRDLANKRKKARHQIEQLNAGRERLLEAYDVVRTTVDVATTELEVSVVDARRAATVAGRRVDDEPDASLAELDAEVTSADLGGMPIVVSRMSGPKPTVVPEPEEVAAPAPEPEPEPEPLPTPEPEPEPLVVPVRDPLPPSVRAVVDDARVATPEASSPSTSEFDPIQVPIARHRPKPAPAPAPDAEPEPAVAVAPPAEPAVPSKPKASKPKESKAPKEPKLAAAVFAQLQEGVEAPAPVVEEAVADEPADDASPDDAAFRHRAEALEAIEKDFSRRLKRTLADEQNEVLDRLRTAKPKSVDDLLPSPEDHAARWVAVAAPALADAAAAGAAWVGGKPGSTKHLAKELAGNLVQPLRERVDRSFEASDGNLDDVADRVRALYREWKNQRLAEAGPAVLIAAYAHGLFEAANTGAKVRWVVDPERGPCPDCDDNVLAGVVVKGDEFPTGNRCAPAHPGCHCLVLVHEDVLLTTD